LTLLTAAVFYFAPGLLSSLPGLALLALFLLLAPSTGLPVVAMAIPFYRQPKEIMGNIFGMAEIVTLMVFAAWAVRWLMDWLASIWRKERSPWNLSIPGVPEWELTPLDWGMVALGLVSLLSLFVAQGKRVALREFRTVVFEPLLFYLLLRATLRDRQRLWHVADGWIFSGLVIAIWGLAQFASGRGIITAEGVWRVRGPYGSPNNLALMLGRQLPLLIAVAAFSRSRWRQIAYALILLPAAAAFYFTYSRAGWLAGLPIPLLFLGLVRGGRAAWGAVGALVAGGLSAIPTLSSERFRSLLNPRQGTLFFRLRLWQSSLAMIRDHPLLGVGLDNFLYQYRSRYILPSAWQEPNLSHPHNLLLEFWTRLGVLGVGTLAWVEIRFFRRAWRLYRRLPEGDQRALALGAMGGMVNVLSHGLVDNGFFVIDLAYAFCLLVGLIAQMAEQAN
jgi:O-antigen ligase